MVNVDFFYRGTLEDPGYQQIQEWLTALADGRPTRTWEYWYPWVKAPGGHRALDVGALNTFFCYALQERYENVYACDDYSWARRNLGQKVPEPGQWEEEVGARGVCAGYGDITRLPYPKGWFDLVTAASVIEHVKDDRQALKELLRVGRRVVVTTDIADFPVGYLEHERVYSQETLAELIQEVTGQDVAFGPMPPRGEWMYENRHTVCGFCIDA